MREPGPEGNESMSSLRDRAILATDLAFTITDPTQDDNPLVWVNPAFSRVTGYSPDEVLGQNCRFMQSDDTDPATLEAIRQAIGAGEAITATLLNRRKDGTSFSNHLSISPVLDDEGRLVGFVGVQADVSEQVRIDAERELALAAERTARAETERARNRLGLLVEATTQLASTLDVSEAMARLATIAVPRMADWAVIVLIDDRGRPCEVTARHRDGHRELLDRYTAAVSGARHEGPSMHDLRSSAEPYFLSEGMTDSLIDQSVAPDQGNRAELVDIVNQLGCQSVLSIPLITRRNRLVGTMTLVSGPSGRRFSREDVEEAADLGRRAGLTIHNAQLYEQEHRVAETLQRSLLPALPRVGRTTIAALYLPAEATADVGGDFYDILPLPDHSIGFAIGDVVGHDLAAAAAMGHLRGLLRACAWDDAANDAGGDPGRVINRVDRLVQGLDVVPLATLFYGRLVLGSAPGDDACFTYANAGHPSPLLRLPNGAVRRLDRGAGVLLGVTDLGPHPTAEVTVPVGSVLVGYTDGLVERRGVDVDSGIATLEKTLAALPAEMDPQAVLDRLLATIEPGRDDDLAVLAVRVDS